MRNCISYELTRKLAKRRREKEREEAILGFVLPMAVAICTVVCLGIILCA